MNYNNLDTSYKKAFGKNGIRFWELYFERPIFKSSNWSIFILGSVINIESFPLDRLRIYLSRKNEVSQGFTHNINWKYLILSVAEMKDEDKGASQSLTCRNWDDKRPPIINVSWKIRP